ncbi:lytic transglycosylase domain-containing protein [Subtercola vilae]|uniref:Lytic transglycosylase domain-containing protein n=1 Tax=Subtercola vilae TaxID=2056433 RepID=A0A4T2C4Y3_9MICO|nr:lytic transglycosylase domain-containing protein [Subtercola vilae]MEA9986286.1 lytic transglycosylase domain-containing protein [Subtercola sp. RTI3]TIH38271.1 lytic transglycosylase domain-containing protein [Subtercola vilae]
MPRPRQHRAPLDKSRLALQGFGFLAAVAFVAITAVDPYTGATASAYFTVTIKDTSNLPTQALSSGRYENAVSRDGYSTKAAPPPPVVVAVKTASSAPSAATPDPGSAKAIAHDMIVAKGWGEDEYSCLVSLFNRESGWNVSAYNAGSGAYGIPQALPGGKMASVGADWQTSAATQITWGLGYITSRYGTPCGAWGHSEDQGWY